MSWQRVVAHSGVTIKIFESSMHPVIDRGVKSISNPYLSKSTDTLKTKKNFITSYKSPIPI